MIWVLLIIIVIAIASYFLLARGPQEKRKQGQLKSAIQRKMRVNEKRAEEYIADMKRRLEKKYPGRSEEWYLEKILSDLERGR